MLDDRQSLAKKGSWFVSRWLLPKLRAPNGHGTKKKNEISISPPTCDGGEMIATPEAAAISSMWTLMNDSNSHCGIGLPLEYLHDDDADSKRSCSSPPSSSCSSLVISETPASYQMIKQDATTLKSSASSVDNKDDDNGYDVPPPCLVPPRVSPSTGRAKRKASMVVTTTGNQSTSTTGRQSRATSTKRSKADKARKEETKSQAIANEMIVSSAVVMIDRTTNAPTNCTVLESTDGCGHEIVQRKWWENSTVSGMVRHYDPVHHQSTQYGIGASNAAHFASMAHYQYTESPDGFVMLRCLAPNQGKQQQDLMNRLVAKMIRERGDEDKGVQQMTGTTDTNSHIRYSSDHVFEDGTPFVMQHTRLYHKNGYKRGKDNTNKASAVTELRRHVEIALLDPSPGMMLKLRRIYMAENKEPLEVGRFNGCSKLGDFQIYVDGGMAARYIKQGTTIT